jgi:polar amino acid transport system permease protein
MTDAARATTQSFDDIRSLTLVKPRHYGRWLTAAAILIVLALIVKAFAEGQIAWHIVGRFLTVPAILYGLVNTIIMTFAAMALGITLGVLFAIMYMSPNPVLKSVAVFYIWFFRGTPLLVQIIFWFNIQLFIPSLDIGSIHLDTNAIVTAFVAALLALSLNESAYMAEIMRSGLMAVDNGQHEAAKALGYTPTQAMLRIILPQALRIIIPPIGNQTISMLKTTSLVSVVAAQDLLTRAQNIYARNFLIIELLIVASIWYLVMTTVASILQYAIEQRLGRSASQPPAAWRAALRLLRAEGSNG